MKLVSVIIPTHDRLPSLERAVRSVLAQTYRDIEIIIVDDGGISALPVIKPFNSERIRYIKSPKPHSGGSAARNLGIREAIGEFIAFLDDDDEWLPEKLSEQMVLLDGAPNDVAFSFSAVWNDLGNRRERTHVPEGVGDYHLRALRRFNGFLTVTLVIRRSALLDVGLFDESLVSHQEPELMIRLTRKYRGTALDEPLAVVDMTPGHEQIGGNVGRRIRGLERLLAIHGEEFRHHPDILGLHLFKSGILYRNVGEWSKSASSFMKSMVVRPRFRTLGHLLVVAFGGYPYRLFHR